MKLVTGGAGFFGVHLVGKLLEAKEKVRIIDTASIEPASLAERVEFVNGDIRDYNKVLDACDGVDTVFHSAAVLPVARAGKKYIEVNVDGTRNVLEACLKKGISRVVYVSTSAVYFGIPAKLPIDETTELHPVGKYGWAKFHAEELCRKYRKEFGLKVSIVRPRPIVGSGRLGIFQILFDWLKDGKRIYILGSGNNRFQFVSAPDLADACMLVAAKAPGEDFNIGAEKFTTLGKDLEALVAYARTKSRVAPLNPAFCRIVLRFLDTFRLSPLVEWHYKTYDKDFYFDIGKAKRMLGWAPRDGNVDMLCQTYDWYLKNYKVLESRFGTTHRYSLRQGVLKLLKAVS